MIAYTLPQDVDGQWSIRCMSATLVSGLQLAPPIRQAHQMAHTARMNTGRPTCVEVLEARADIRVADEAPREPRCRSITA